jgi:hypothetical protein
MHIGQLANALLRDARYLSAIGLHTGGMTVAESVALFRDKALQPEGTARQQAARGTFDPAYLNYTLGKLMIMRLRDDWLAGHGGRAQLRGFHDQFLSYGGPPIPLVRAQMLGGPVGGEAVVAAGRARAGGGADIAARRGVAPGDDGRSEPASSLARTSAALGAGQGDAGLALVLAAAVLVEVSQTSSDWKNSICATPSLA